MMMIFARVASGLETDVVVTNSRYLRNSGGTQVAHWVAVLTQIIPHVLFVSEMQQQATVDIHLEDTVRSPRELRAILKLLTTNDYVDLTVKAAKLAFGVNMVITVATPSKTALRVDAGQFPINDTWWTNGGERFSIAARHVASCPDDNTLGSIPDVLIYNRKGSRHITNTRQMTETLQADGLSTIVVTVTKNLTPAQQICLVATPYKYIITPHGGQMASLLFKNALTSVVEVSPSLGVLECFRFIRPAAEVWFAMQNTKIWECDGFCVDTARQNVESIGAKLFPADCELCSRKVKGATITVDLGALKTFVTGRLIDSNADNG